ncbi:hypothetical protein HOG17_03790 [Candidatus Peregrinibacteria bacterium]|nr:hypothetical protein [Candidatus Peregrinibacteria bacterium]MBT4148325.1 hypothetical protein [Candidatus Peregrinibacteria bacterium]MBT4366394.1 hypothetical protein [Candidatus Peregrinibacteria bacterium]MBT4455922.1 hypothetical protein [Candidatus Peregrinibacteria bacterium]
MFETSADIMRMSFGIGFLVLVIFLSMALLYVIFILRDVSKILDDVKDVTDKVKVSVVSPLKAMNVVIEKITPIVNQLLDAKKKSGKKKK